LTGLLIWHGLIHKFYMAVHSRPLFVSDSPTGPFECIGSFINPDGTIFNPTDPALFKDDDGRLYMIWHGNRIHPERGVLATLTYGAELAQDNPRKLITEKIILNEFNPEHTWECFGQYNQDEEFGWVEGQHLLKHNNRYYLIYAGCGTQFSSYAMGAYYSDIGPLGPYIYQKNNPITINKVGLMKGAGHGCVVHGPNNTLWAFYTTPVSVTHCFERTIGMDYISVNKDGELYCPRITDTPQYAPGVVNDQEKDGDVGLYPLTFGQRATHRCSSHTEGRNSFYALDENLTTWWQPKHDDPEKTLLVHLSAPYTIEASRIIWRSVGLDYDKGVVPGPFKYKIEGCNEPDGDWFTVIDMTDNDIEYINDYRTFPPVVSQYVKLTITGCPDGIEPGVVSFVVFGKRVKES
jgi:xylan 1,4-beta-xylosidase